MFNLTCWWWWGFTSTLWRDLLHEEQSSPAWNMWRNCLAVQEGLGFLQHTFFNINYFFLIETLSFRLWKICSGWLWHLQSDRWTVVLLNPWYCVCLMSLFHCVVLKNWLIMPLPHSLPTCSSSLLLCLPAAGSMLLIPNTWDSYIWKLCSPSKHRLRTHRWFCKPGTVVSAKGREVEDWSWWRLVKWAN